MPTPPAAPLPLSPPSVHCGHAEHRTTVGRQDKQLSNGLVFNHTVHSARTGLTEGVGREHAAYVMDSAARQATAQTARTLRFDAALPPDADTITVEEFAKLLLREIAAAVRSFPPPDARPCP